MRLCYSQAHFLCLLQLCRTLSAMMRITGATPATSMLMRLPLLLRLRLLRRRLLLLCWLRRWL